MSKLELMYKCIVLLLLSYISLYLWVIDTKQDISLWIIDELSKEWITITVE